MPKGTRGRVKCSAEGCENFSHFFGLCQKHARQTDPDFRERNNGYQKVHAKRVKDLCYAAYGGYRCSCEGCTETHPAFLTLDHVLGGGNKHRKEMEFKNGRAIYEWIVKNNFPEGMFRVLCYNCNCGRSRNGGICPHLDSGDDSEC